MNTLNINDIYNALTDEPQSYKQICVSAGVEPDVNNRAVLGYRLARLKKQGYATHKKIVLLDNNILFDKDWFYTVTDWILDNKMSVDFNQGLDIRLLDQDVANRLKQLKHFKPWHFAFDSLSYKDYVLNGMDMLRNAGINLRSSVIWYVFMNDDSQFDSALERCNILRENDTMPYPMLNPVNEHTRRMKDLKRWCRPWFFFTMPFEEYKPRGE